MQSGKFLELQYQSLRLEIENSKRRVFQLIVGGAIVIPSAQFLAKSQSIGILTLILPMIVIIVMLVFTYERISIQRCGRYIRLFVEPNVESSKLKSGQEQSSWQSWEEWLESRATEYKPRVAEKFLIYGFSALSAVYYLVSAFISASFAYSKYGLWPMVGLVIAYAAIAFPLFWFIGFQHWKVGTKDEGEE